MKLQNLGELFTKVKPLKRQRTDQNSEKDAKKFSIHVKNKFQALTPIEQERMEQVDSGSKDEIDTNNTQNNTATNEAESHNNIEDRYTKRITLIKVHCI